ncbi:MAG: SUMF1/EgtB/PvdO family nonheme iron enzyme, partial [Pyrinomonadaceae bacterium]
MICPYCLEDVPANTQQHAECKINKVKKYPLFYTRFHGGEGASEPIILSVVGFSGHGKTVYLCALFDFLDNRLSHIWPKFYNHVLDQDSLSRLNENRAKLRKGELPERTRQSFPRPGIFRLTNMPHVQGSNGMPPLDDTTVLIYDPPGEAFDNESKIVDWASFVKRSSCVLFLVDVTTLGDSIADKMAELLDTYLLSMELMGIEKGSQHLIVVYTKSDDMKVSVPEFSSYLEKEPKLKDYLSEEQPETLANPRAHLNRLEHISDLLEKFTWSELNASKFINVAKDWFVSVSYTAVSSLGGAPEEYINEAGEKEGRLPFKMSPRSVADPLLYVLAKSIKVKPPEPEPKRWALIATIAGIGALILLVLLMWLVSAVTGSSNTSNTSPSQKIINSPTPNNSNRGITPPPRMAYVPGGEFTMGSDGGDAYERPPHKVTVKPFFIDAYEVTCEEYA